MADVTVPTAAPLANLPGVELAQTGQWDISTGTVTLTQTDLLNAVAAQECPAVRRPVLKLGHVDPRFDGEPACGWVGNLSVNASGTTLSGDYTGMPGWLGEILPSAYPDRSIEATYDFVCQIGHTHPFVLTAVALLGVTAPGIGTLESLQDVATLFDVAASPTALGKGFPVSIRAKGASTMPNPRPHEIAAGVTTEDIRREYYDTAPMSHWITAMELDPLQLIVNDDATGQLSRVPVTLSGGTFTFGEAVPVEIQYTDKAPATANASRLVYASRDESRPPAPAPAPDPSLTPAQAIERVHKAATVADDTKGGSMDPIKIREAFGLKSDATDEEVQAAITAAGLVPAPVPAPVPDPAPAPVPVPVAASGSGVVTVDESILKTLQESARRGDMAFAEMQKNRRDSVISAAIEAGKFAPSRKGDFERLWNADPTGTEAMIDGLAPGLVPVHASGYAGTESFETDTAFYGLYPEKRPSNV